MAIKKYGDEETLTPKQAAEHILWDATDAADYWIERHPEMFHGMTEREQDQVNTQLAKIIPRIAKLLHQ